MMVSNLDFINIAMTSLKRMYPNQKVIFKTFKKDRKVEVLKLESSYTIIENGFKNNIIEDLEYKEVKKILKKLQKIEFPRSNKLWYSIT
ncbi:MAG: hypothetical protein KIB43_01145 [Clostridium baratii]|uniref:hypothetical protein n=1 Tax=Clostridium baratii TaxID=1561 RepID=UPI00242DF135|nr:hypothetical protein [Clostridium baratii]MBS6005541.1 hypothetical protein [Clostridium baratii]